MNDNLKRQFPRVTLSCDVEYKINADPFLTSRENKNKQNSDKEISKTKDISVGGICMITYSPLPKDICIDLSFKLRDSGKIIKALGQVMWTEVFSIGNSNGYDNGIRFIEMDEKDKELLRQYLESEND